MNPFIKKLKLALQNPHLTIQKINMLMRSHLITKWDYYLRKGYAHPPSCLCFKLTNKHNFACSLCGQKQMMELYGENFSVDYFQQSVDLEIYKSLINRVASFKPNIFIRQCGEPFLYADILPLLDYIKSKKLSCQINTDGYFLKENAKDLVKIGVDDLIISIDGPSQFQNKNRNSPDSYERALEGAQAIYIEKEKQRSQNPVLRIRGMINVDTAFILQNFIKITKEFKADALTFLWMWFTDEDGGKKHQELLNQLFNLIKADSWRFFLLQKNNKMNDVFLQIEKALEYFHKGDIYFPIILSPKVSATNVEDYFTNTAITFGSEKCYAVWNKTYIFPNGDVSPCPHYSDYIAGNIMKTEITEIWNNKAYRLWRTELKKQGRFPICYRCCDLADIEIL